MQIGSTGKVYTMVTALEQGVPFGYAKTVPFQADVSGYTNCKGQPAGPILPNGQLGWQVHNDESEPGGHYTLVHGDDRVDQRVLRLPGAEGRPVQRVKTAAQMGLTWPDGKSLLKPDRQGQPERGQRSVVHARRGQRHARWRWPRPTRPCPARGIYCSPIAITKIVTTTGAKLPVESANCHRVLSQAVADAANYILQGDLTAGTATADTIGRPAASKTGTADDYTSAFFVGYTPDLLGAVWVGNPKDLIPMAGYPSGCWRYPDQCPAAAACTGPWHPATPGRSRSDEPSLASQCATSWRCRSPVRCSRWATGPFRASPPPPHHGGGAAAVAAAHGGPPATHAVGRARAGLSPRPSLTRSCSLLLARDSASSRRLR